MNPRLTITEPGKAPGEDFILTPEAVDFIIELNDLASARAASRMVIGNRL